LHSTSNQQAKPSTRGAIHDQIGADRPPRTGRNPKSGEKVQVPEKRVPHFKAGKELRERVDFKKNG